MKRTLAVLGARLLGMAAIAGAVGAPALAGEERAAAARSGDQESGRISLKVDLALPSSETDPTPLAGTLKPGWTPFAASRWADMYMHDAVWEDAFILEQVEPGLPIGESGDPMGTAGLPAIAFRSGPGKVEVLAGEQPLATYYFEDEKTTRPYFAHVHAPGGVRVTRNHPPVPESDAVDHAELHPGIWLAFGDLGGADSWRNKARVKHEKFVAEPEGGAGKGTFTAENFYLSVDGKKTICRETCRITFLVRPHGYLLLWDSAFRSDEADFSFGDQEEMGLGVRVATPLAVKQGGRILTSDGHRNEKEVRGKSSAWCDYGGTIDGRRAGITLMPHPENFRPCWYHARDYGFVAANPFGRKALTRGEPSEVVVEKGETFRLRFGILLHAAPGEEPADLAAAYRDYLELSAAE